MLDYLDQLPAPQHDALATVFGMSEGTPPDRFLVGLATLALAAEAAEQQPLLIVEDAQWLDHASAQVFGFADRRLLAERVALVAAPRAPTGDQVLADLPEVSINGLDDSDARTLLLENVPGASPLQCATRSSPNATAIHSPSSRSRAVYRLCSAARMRSPFSPRHGHHASDDVAMSSGRSASVELTWLCASSRSVLRLELDPA